MLLHLKTQQEFLTVQATLKRNEFVCRAKRKRIAKKARALLFRPGWASQTVYMRKSCLAYPGYPTCRGETTRLPELSRPPELSHPPHVNGNLVPRVFHLPTPKGAREERPWLRLVTCLGNKFIFKGGVPIYQSIVAAALCYLLKRLSGQLWKALFRFRSGDLSYQVKSHNRSYYGS